MATATATAQATRTAMAKQQQPQQRPWSWSSSNSSNGHGQTTTATAGALIYLMQQFCVNCAATTFQRNDFGFTNPWVEITNNALLIWVWSLNQCWLATTCRVHGIWPKDGITLPPIRPRGCHDAISLSHKRKDHHHMLLNPLW